MIEACLTRHEMNIFTEVITRYRDNFDQYRGSQMLQTTVEEFSQLANRFLDAVRQAQPIQVKTPVRFRDQDDIRIFSRHDGFDVYAGNHYDILCGTAVEYERSRIKDQDKRTTLANISMAMWPKNIPSGLIQPKKEL